MKSHAVTTLRRIFASLEAAPKSKIFSSKSSDVKQLDSSTTVWIATRIDSNPRHASLEMKFLKVVLTTLQFCNLRGGAIVLRLWKKKRATLDGNGSIVVLWKCPVSSYKIVVVNFDNSMSPMVQFSMERDLLFDNVSSRCAQMWLNLKLSLSTRYIFRKRLGGSQNVSKTSEKPIVKLMKNEEVCPLPESKSILSWLSWKQADIHIVGQRWWTRVQNRVFLNAGCFGADNYGLWGDPHIRTFPQVVQFFQELLVRSV